MSRKLEDIEHLTNGARMTTARPRRRRPPRRGPLREPLRLARLQALVLLRPAPRPGQHPPRPAAGQQRRRRRRRHRLRHPPAPRHGDRHVGDAGLAGPPGLHRPQRRDLPRPGPADERRHAASCTRRRTTRGGSRARRTRSPCTSCRCGSCPTSAASTPGYEQLEIDDELLTRRRWCRSPPAWRATTATPRSGSPTSTPPCTPRGCSPAQSRRAARGAVPAPVRAPRRRHARGRRRRSATGDAVRFTATGGQRVTATEPAEILVWEMHADHRRLSSDRPPRDDHDRAAPRQRPSATGCASSYLRPPGERPASAGPRRCTTPR